MAIQKPLTQIFELGRDRRLTLHFFHVFLQWEEKCKETLKTVKLVAPGRLLECNFWPDPLFNSGQNADDFSLFQKGEREQL